MAATTRPRRLFTVAAATLMSVALVAGCGGSDVTDTAAQGAATGVETATDTTAIDTGTAATGTDTTGGAAVPGAVTGGTGTTDTTAPGTTAGTAGGTGGAGTGGTAGQPGTAAKPGKAGGAGGAGAAAGGSALEQLVATAPIFGGTGACKPATLSEIPIGNVSTLSGVLGELFSPVTPALQTFVASQNACGGLNGHKIKFVQADDQGDPSTAASKVQELIQSQKVLAFVGNIQVLTVDAVTPVIKRTGIPVIGGDLTNNTWFTNPLLFPQGSPPQAVSYGYLQAAKDYFKKTNVGSIWCIEVPRACEQIDRAFKELAPTLGMTMKKSVQVSITAPSYVQQCLDLKNSGVEVLAMTIDAASQNRIARSCEQVGFFPKVLPYPLGVGNEKQFLGNKWLGDSYVTMNHFPWMGNTTPAEKYWQASVKKYNPGFTSGGAASLGWTAGALLVAASSNLSAENPTSQQFLDALWQFKGQKFTQLGGLSGPLTFRQNSTPKVPYCLFGAISNASNTGWARTISKPSCTNIIAPSDPQKNS